MLPVVNARASQRRVLRRQRRSLPAARRRQLETALLGHLRRLLWRRFRRIGAYLPFDGEADITPLLRQLVARGRYLALPRLEGRRGYMRYVAWHPDVPLSGNRYRIPEPDGMAARVDTFGLDLVLTPLVAFDATGTRLGMGAGYFDRHFARLRNRGRWRRPLLVGVAFGFQEVEHLERAAWDVPLAGVVTENGFRPFD